MSGPRILRASSLPLGWRLVAWMVIFVLPVLGLWYGGAAVVRQEERSLDLVARRQLLDEMDRYLQDLQLERVIEERMDRIQRRMSLPSPDQTGRFIFQGDPGHLTAPVLADRLLGEIRSSFGGEPLFVCAVGPDCAEVALRTDPRLLSGVQVPARRLMQQWMILLAGQLDRRPAGAPAFLEEIRRRWGGEAGRARLMSDFDRFISNQFGVFAAPFGLEGECRAFYVHRFGGERIILYHRLVTAGREPSDPLLGGFLIAFRESSFSMRHLLVQARKRPNRANLERSWTVPASHRETGFYRHRKDLVYLHQLPDTCLVHRGTRGRSALQLMRLPPPKKSETMPVARLMVRCSASALQHPLRDRWLSLGIWSAAVLLAGLLFLSFGERWGAAVHWSIRHQLLVAVGVAVGIPLLGLWMIAGASLAFHQKLQMQRHLLAMSDDLEALESALVNYNRLFVDRFWGVSEKVVGLRKASEAATRSALQKLWKEFPAIDDFYLLREDGVFLRHRPGTGMVLSSRHDNAYAGISYRLLSGAEGMTPEGIAALKRHRDGRTVEVFAEGMSESELQSILIAEDNVLASKIPGSKGRQMCFMLLSSSGAKPDRPWGLLGRFDSYLRLAEEFSRTRKEPWKLFHRRGEMFTTRTAIFLATGKRGSGLEHGVSLPREAWSDRELVRLARGAVQGSRSGTWIEEREGGNTLMAVRPLTGLPLVAVSVAEPDGAFLEDGLDRFEGMALLGAHSLLIMLLIVMLLTASFLRPIRILTQAAARVSSGDLSSGTSIETGDEFTLVATEFNRMVRGLRERHRLSRFVSDDLHSVAGGSQRVPRTIVFSHLREFDRLVETRAPEVVVNLLNGYFTVMEEAVKAEQGTIDKFIGDAVMAVFAPRPGLDPEAVRACRAAIGMNRALRQFNQRRVAAGLFSLRHGIGIASGEVIAGDIGSVEGRQLALTVIGDVVNLAARLEANAHLATTSGILVCAGTVSAGAAFPAANLSFRPVGALAVKGKTRTVEAAELQEAES